MGLKLFVDDKKLCPKGWHRAKTITEAIRILTSYPVDEISLDHDIENSEETFEPVAHFLAHFRGETYSEECPEGIKIRIHTGNVDGGRKMANILGLVYDQVFALVDYKNYNPEGLPVKGDGETLVEPEVKLDKIPDYGDHMTMEHFVECCRSGGFINYDGSGRYATADKITDKPIIPSDVMNDLYDKSYTHVVWFNK